MKTTLIVSFCCVFVISTHATDFTHRSAFDSVEAFIVAVKAFQPAAAPSEMSSLFTIPEMGENRHGEPIIAATIQSCRMLWSGPEAALVMASANPSTVATRACVSVLFLLKRQDGHWQMVDRLRFTAAGKEAQISAELTAGTGAGYELGSEGMAPVVTIKENHGGRGYAYEISASYTFDASTLWRLDPK